MKILTLIFAVFFIAALALPAAAAPRSTENFVKNAAAGNEFELLSSQLALEKSQSEPVKKFAGLMLKDHGKVAEKMRKALAEAQFDAAAPDLDDKRRKLLDKMKNAQEADFDKQYISAQVMAHDEAVDLFSMYSRRGENDALKAFAADTLPTLKAHQEHIKELNTTRR